MYISRNDVLEKIEWINERYKVSSIYNPYQYIWDENIPMLISILKNKSNLLFYKRELNSFKNSTYYPEISEIISDFMEQFDGLSTDSIIENKELSKIVFESIKVNEKVEGMNIKGKLYETAEIAASKVKNKKNKNNDKNEKKSTVVDFDIFNTF